MSDCLFASRPKYNKLTTIINILISPTKAMQYLDYRVGLVSFCSKNLPEGGTPVLKHVGG
jgi:hypothetical protein